MPPRPISAVVSKRRLCSNDGVCLQALSPSNETKKRPRLYQDTTNSVLNNPPAIIWTGSSRRPRIHEEVGSGLRKRSTSGAPASRSCDRERLRRTIPPEAVPKMKIAGHTQPRMPDTRPRMTVTGFPCVLQMEASRHAGAGRDRRGTGLAAVSRRSASSSRGPGRFPASRPIQSD